ncbi:uncharacterized protein LOC130173143 isoform X2 [Seriola aureovittata]|uniref:uncharacterized protein LOC130173143 isoform X2 n=1 Tax=Seriola aureovittata TaxID=2871759 RepID=UPI0024BE7EC4|nr:uncharacterized protein LOC130173143 isoform X2 [Seriola aureovittata]
MEQVLIFLVMLAGVTHVAETRCNSTKNTYLCSVTPGGSVHIQVITNASGHQVWCKKQILGGSISVFTLKNEKLTINRTFSNRTEFFINNGTFMMTNMEKNDSGQYIMEAFDSKGVFVRKIDVQLDVEELASSNLMPVLAGVGALLLLIAIFTVSCCVCKCRKKSDSGI